MQQLSPLRLRVTVCAIFLLLGAQTGLRAVGIFDIYLRLQLAPGQLGLLASTGVVSGILTLVTGARLVDRFGRRPILVIGLGVTGCSFLLTTQAGNFAELVGVWAIYGLACSLVDLGANTIAADFERSTETAAMTGFHAWFSAGAAAGALSAALALHAGTTFRPIFAVMGIILILGAALHGRARLPARQVDTMRPSVPTGGSVTRIPLVLLATGIVFLCFFGDGILETFLATFVRTSSTALVAGLSISAFHSASWAGRMLSDRLVRIWGERFILIGAGAVAGTAIGATVAARDGFTVVIVLMLVGFAISPIVPIGFSLAGRAAPHAIGQAVGFVTTIGYTGFILSPALAGVLAEQTSLGLGIALAGVTFLLVAVLATRIPVSDQHYR